MTRFSRQLKNIFYATTLTKKRENTKYEVSIPEFLLVEIFDEWFSKIDRQMFDAKVAREIKIFQ